MKKLEDVFMTDISWQFHSTQVLFKSRVIIWGLLHKTDKLELSMYY